VTIARLLLGGLLVFGTACTSTPSKPTPPDQGPGPGPVVQNTPPTIGAFRAQGSRTGQPANFVDLGESIALSVTVTDPESAASGMTFNWASTSGTFSGTGPSVTWRAPASATTPMDVTLALEVVETYQSQGRNVENRVTGSTTVSLHNSIQEVSDLARQFLLDFSSSSLPVDYVMRNFEPGCHGTNDETEDVADNRENFTILESNVGQPVTTVGFAGACTYRNRRADACSRVPVYWRSQAKRDIPGTQIKKGEISIATGVDQLAAMYYANLKRWRLCDSDFDSGKTSLTSEPIRGLVP
jgi:hypothetical protein